MRPFLMLTFAAVLAGMTSYGLAGDLTSGLAPGEEVDAFDVEKCAGAVNDGKEIGANFCYRCALGNKPVVVVFARKADASLAKLVRKLEESIAAHKEQELSSFVNLLGPNAEELKATAKKFGANNKVEYVALVVPQDNENGPPEYKINPEAEVTVMLYRQGKVEANHSFAAGKLDEQGIASIIKDTSKILN